MRCRSTTGRGAGRRRRGRIVVFARSLGTALAAHVAGVVLVSPYDSLAAIGNHHYPWLPVSLLRHRFDAQAGCAPLPHADAHDRGELGQIIPVKRSRALYDAWAGPKSWQIVPGSDHNTLGATSDFWNGVTDFLAQHVAS